MNLPAQQPNCSPATSTGIRRLSLVSQNTSRKSPLNTPPQRKAKTNSRLSIYGVPINMTTGRTNSALRNVLTVDGGKKIVVAARKRPITASEASRGVDCVQVDSDARTVRLSVQRTKLDGLGKYAEEFDFNFDHVYDENSSNREIFKEVVGPLVEFALKGGKATCFAYGQTGSGKTHTMFNSCDGQCLLAIEQLLRRKDRMLECYVDFFEIYQGQLHDLLQERRRVVPCERKDGVVKIMGLMEELAENADHARELVQRGLKARITGKTGANAQSSRSHGILHFTLKAKDQIHGRLTFIDLAGSERGADRAEVDRRTKLEGSEINKSLLALKECIRAIDQDASHLPFRQSKLTLVLKDSIVGGEVKTAMIATISPAINSSEHSLNTLRYAEKFYEISTLAAGREGYENVPPSKTKSIDLDWLVSSPAVKEELQTPSLHAQQTPIKKKLTFEEDPQDTVEKRRETIIGTLMALQLQVEECNDRDVLDLLQEELSNLCHAFQSLS